MILILVVAAKTFGQKYSLYSNDSLLLASKYLGKDIRLNLHLPETHPFSAESTKYPITIVFDSQHKRTYPQIISSFDLLTSETQIPESIIIGIPFTRHNRLYLTSMQKRGKDSISGIERLTSFLFHELIPKLQKDYKGGKFISLIGHSRTAFLVNYLSYKKPSQVNLAVALSGFFNDQPLSTSIFYEFLTHSNHFTNKFFYYHTSGTTLEESTYWKQSRSLDSLLHKKPVAKNVKVVFSETKSANHISNYWVSVPSILMDAFSPYNSILDSWFHDEKKVANIINPVEQFEKDLQQASTSIGLDLNPNLTHIFSLASLYANKDEFITAIKFFELGLEYFPDYLDFYVEIIAYYKAINNTEKINAYKNILREKTLQSQYLSDKKKQEVLEYLDEK